VVAPEVRVDRQVSLVSLLDTSMYEMVFLVASVHSTTIVPFDTTSSGIGQ
jgi:hypothetical protein